MHAAGLMATSTPATSAASQLIEPARTVRDYLSDSSVWRAFLAQGGFAPGDIVVADPFKAGTTWTQRIVQQILDDGEEPAAGLSDTSPWLDSSWGDHARMLRVLREQRDRGERRVIKSHLPADALPIDARARYVFVGRNGKDIGISFHNYLKHFSAETMAAIDRVHAEWSGDPSPLVIPESMQAFFDRWLDTDGYGCCDLFDVVRSWWALRDRPNVLLVHYQALLKDDLPAAGRADRAVHRRRSGPAADGARSWSTAPSDTCAARAEQLAPFGGAHMDEPKAFFHKGPARDFRAELTPEQIERFDRKAAEKLGPRLRPLAGDREPPGVGEAARFPDGSRARLQEEPRHLGAAELRRRQLPGPQQLAHLRPREGDARRRVSRRGLLGRHAADGRRPEGLVELERLDAELARAESRRTPAARRRCRRSARRRRGRARR